MARNLDQTKMKWCPKCKKWYMAWIEQTVCAKCSEELEDHT